VKAIKTMARAMSLELFDDHELRLQGLDWRHLGKLGKMPARGARKIVGMRARTK